MSRSCALRYSAFGGRCHGPNPGWFKHEDSPGVKELERDRCRHGL